MHHIGQCDARSSNNKWQAEIPAGAPVAGSMIYIEGWLSVAGYRLRNKGTRCGAVVSLRF